MRALAWCSILLDPAGSKASKTVATGKIYQGLASHDLAVVTVRGEDPSVPEFATGTPCHISYGWNPHQLEDFYGYVNHIVPPYQRTQFHDQNYYMDVVCISASYIYKSALSRLWTNFQYSSAVSQLAMSGMFSAILEADDPVWVQLSCPGDSAWTFLKEAADRLGWVLACNKTNIRFLSVDRALSKNQATMPTFRSLNQPTPAVDSITSFESLQGETVPLDGHTRFVRTNSNIDMRSGQVFSVENDASIIDSTSIGLTSVPPLFEKNEIVMAHSQLGAQWRLDGEAQRNRFHIQAKATVAGDTNVVQGIPIVLLGLGPLNSGVWFVEEVVHRISYGLYSLDLTLGRDSSSDGGQRSFHPGYIAWQLGDPVPSVIPPTILVNNQWRAAWESNQVVTL